MATAKTGKNRVGIVQGFKNIKSEVKKVTWPTKKEVFNYTLVVLAMVLMSAIVIGIFDLIFHSLYNLLV